MHWIVSFSSIFYFYFWSKDFDIVSCLDHKIEPEFHRPRQPAEPGVYKCNVCDYVVDNSLDLNKHREGEKFIILKEVKGFQIIKIIENNCMAYIGSLM